MTDLTRFVAGDSLGRDGEIAKKRRLLSGIPRLAGRVGGSMAKLGRRLPGGGRGLGDLGFVELPHPIFHFLAGLETDGTPRLDVNRLARAGVPRGAALPLFDLKDPKVSQLDPALLHEAVDQCVEGGLNHLLGLSLGHVESLAESPDNVLFRHDSSTPSPRETVPSTSPGMVGRRCQPASESGRSEP